MDDQGFKFKPNPYVVARFFERLQRTKTGRLKRTQLQVATGLKSSDFARYLERLLDLGLLELEEEDGKTFIRPTAKGWDLYYSLLQILRELAGIARMEERKRHD